MTIEGMEPTEASWEEDWEKAEAEVSGEPEPKKEVKSVKESPEKDSGNDTGAVPVSKDPPVEEDEEEDDGEEQEEEVEEPEKEEPPEKEGARGTKEERDQFEKLAEKLGFKIADREVTAAERNAFRKRMASKREKLRQDSEMAFAQIQQKAAEVIQRNSRAIKIEQAVEAGDFDGVAAALGYQNWKDVNRAFFEKMADPLHKELASHRKREQEREKKEAEYAERRRQQEVAQYEQRMLAEHAKEVREELSSLPEWKKFATDDIFMQDVVTLQKQSWDGQDEMDLIEAAAAVKKSAFETYKNLKKLFSPDSEDITEQSPADRAGKRKPKRSISRSRVSEASAGTKKEYDSIDDWIKEFQDRI